MAASLLASTNKFATSSSNFTTSAVDTRGATCIVLVVFGGASSTVSDSKSNTWTGLTERSGGSARARIFYCNNPTTDAAHTFTQGAFSTFGAIFVYALQGTDASAFDVENGAGSASASSLAAGSVTPSRDGSFVVTGFVSISTSVKNIAVDSGFTYSSADGLGGQHYGGGAGYLIQGSAAAVNPTWTDDTAAAVAAAIAVFKPLQTSVGAASGAAAVVGLSAALASASGAATGSGLAACLFSAAGLAACAGASAAAFSAAGLATAAGLAASLFAAAGLAVVAGVKGHPPFRFGRFRGQTLPRDDSPWGVDPRNNRTLN